MRGAKILGLMAMASVAASPVFAAQPVNPAQSLSLAPAMKMRAAPVAKRKSDLAGAALVLVVIAGAAGIAGVVAAADGGNSASS